METHKVDPSGSGRAEQHTALELIIQKLKALAASGDKLAHRQLMDLDACHGVPGGYRRVGALVVPQRLTLEEWEAKYSPKDDLPEDTVDFD